MLSNDSVWPCSVPANIPQDSITLEEIENANDLVQNIEKLELPNQLVAVLSEPLLQKIFLLRPQEASHQRLAMWLHSTLQDVLDGSAEDDTLWELLDVLQEFVLQTKVSLETSLTGAC